VGVRIPIQALMGNSKEGKAPLRIAAAVFLLGALAVVTTCVTSDGFVDDIGGGFVLETAARAEENAPLSPTESQQRGALQQQQLTLGIHSMQQLQKQAQESSYPSAGSAYGSAAGSLPLKSDAPETSAAALLTGKVQGAMLTAKQRAKEKASMMGVTAPEARLMVWKAESDAKQEVIEHTLRHSQRTALRHAVQAVTACQIGSKTAVARQTRLRKQATEDRKAEAAMMDRIDSIDPKEVAKLWPLWQNLKKIADQSLAEVDSARQQVAAADLACTEAKAHRTHIQHLTARAGAHVEKVRAAILANYAQRKEALADEIVEAKAKQATVAVMGSHAKKQEDDREIASLAKHVDVEKARLKATQGTATAALMKVLHVKKQLSQSNEASEATTAKVKLLKHQLNELTDAIQDATKKSQTKEQKQAQAASLGEVAQALTHEALQQKQDTEEIAQLEKELQHEQTNVKYAQQKRELVSHRIVAAQDKLQEKQLAEKTLEEQTAKYKKEVAVGHDADTKDDGSADKDEDSKGKDATQLLVEPVLTLTETATSTGPYQVPESHRTDTTVPVFTVSTNSEGHHDPTGLLNSILAQAAVELESNPSAAMKAVLTEARGDEKLNSKKMQGTMQEIRSTRAKYANIARMVQQLDRAAKRGVDRSEAVPEDDGLAPPSSFLAEGAFAEDSGVAGAKSRLRHHKRAQRRAQKLVERQVQAVHKAKLAKFKAGDTAGSRLIAAARAAHATKKLERKAANQRLIAQKVASSDKATRRAQNKLAEALAKEARRSKKQAEEALADQKRSLEDSQAKIKAHADAKLATQRAADQASREAEKAKHAKAKLIKARTARAMQRQADAGMARVAVAKEEAALKAVRKQKRAVRAVTRKKVHEIELMAAASKQATKQAEDQVKASLAAKLLGIKTKLKVKLAALRARRAQRGQAATGA